MNTQFQLQSLTTHCVPAPFAFNHPVKKFYSVSLLLGVCPFVKHCRDLQAMYDLESALEITWSDVVGSRWDLLGMVKAKEVLQECGACNTLVRNFQNEPGPDL